MSARYGTTLILLDISPELDTIQLDEIQKFLFLYLQHPLLGNDKQRKSVNFHPINSPSDVQPSPMDWQKLVKSIKDIKKKVKNEESDGSKSILTSLNQLLLYISATGKTDFHILIISSFNTAWNWTEMYKQAIKSADKSILSITFIDTSSLLSSTAIPNDFYDDNIKTIKSISKKSIILPISKGIEYISQYENMTLPNPEPVELFKGSMSIPLGNSDNEKLANLNFKIQMYPLVKPKILSNYIENKLLTSSEGYPSKKINNFIERRVDPDDLQKRMKLIVEEQSISKGLKVGNSSFISDISHFDEIGTFKTLTIYGFTDQSNIVPWYLKPDCVAIMQSKTGGITKDTSIFTDLVQHLAQNGLVALARMVKKPEGVPKQVILFPRGYIDDLVEINGVIKTLGFIMAECIYLDDERIPSLPNLGKIKIEEDLQKEMDLLVDQFNLIEDGEDLTFDESLMSFNKSYTPFDKYVNSLKPIKEELLIDKTFTGKWKNIVSINEQQKTITSMMAFKVLNNYLKNECKEKDLKDVPSLWEIYHQKEEENKQMNEETIKENWHIYEPIFKTAKLDSINWEQFKFEKRE